MGEYNLDKFIGNIKEIEESSGIDVSVYEMLLNKIKEKNVNDKIKVSTGVTLHSGHIKSDETILGRIIIDKGKLYFSTDTTPSGVTEDEKKKKEIFGELSKNNNNNKVLTKEVPRESSLKRLKNGESNGEASYKDCVEIKKEDIDLFIDCLIKEGVCTKKKL